MGNSLEVDAKEAAEITSHGAKVFVLEQEYNDIEFVSETLKARSAERLDMNDVHPLLMSYGTEEELKKIGKKFDGAVIVCPHGNTSLRLAQALSTIGIKAYSLRKGIAGLRGRPY
jgi:rhodanese-related sulfurtransferase